MNTLLLAILFSISNPTSVNCQPKLQPTVATAYCHKGQTSREFTPQQKLVKTFEFFMINGFTAEQSAGIIGNLLQESKLNPSAVGKGRCYGISQWLGYRFRNLKKFTAARGSPWDCFDSQLAFIIHEFENDESRAATKLKQAKTVRQATAVMGKLYLRPKRVEPIRYKLAQKAYDSWVTQSKH